MHSASLKLLKLDEPRSNFLALSVRHEKFLCIFTASKMSSNVAIKKVGLFF